MKDSNIRLRPLRILDCPFLRNGLRDEVTLKTHELSSPIFSSWLFVWWWIKKTFVLVYCIENDSRRIGFVGLYSLRLGKSAEISIVIFDKSARRLGYGSRSCNILLQNLKKYSIVEKIIARVKTDNKISLSFLQKLGFVEISNFDGIINMSMDLNSQHL